MPDPDDQTVSLPPLQPGWEAAVDSEVAAQHEAIQAAFTADQAVPSYSATDLPSDPATWPRWKKIATTPMVRMPGRFTVETQEGPLACPDGYLALDAEQQPYPVKADPATGWPLNHEPAEPEPASDDPYVTVGQLTGNLCEAVGLDPEKVRGFRLTVDGGRLPLLEAYPVHPHNRDGQLLDMWSPELHEVLADTTMAVLPGKGDTPPAAPRPSPIDGGWQTPPEVDADLWLVQYLPMILDGLNGAPMDADTRDTVTARGHHVVEELYGRVLAARTWDGPPPIEYDPPTPDPDPDPY